mmetsp:Transcript_26327/g.71235  ORF Transcript_26327/g.71235 Transcript_26327/m.71235 type:complete len:209 (-) Transcript_26327:1691-2317(-)
MQACWTSSWLRRTWGVSRSSLWTTPPTLGCALLRESWPRRPRMACACLGAAACSVGLHRHHSGERARMARKRCAMRVECVGCGRSSAPRSPCPLLQRVHPRPAMLHACLVQALSSSSSSNSSSSHPQAATSSLQLRHLPKQSPRQSPLPAPHRALHASPPSWLPHAMHSLRALASSLRSKSAAAVPRQWQPNSSSSSPPSAANVAAQV